MRFAFRWGIYGAWPALSKAAPSVLLQTVYLVPRMKMRQHRAIMAYCMRCKFLLCAFYLSWAKGEGCPQACRTAVASCLRTPPWADCFACLGEREFSAILGTRRGPDFHLARRRMRPKPRKAQACAGPCLPGRPALRRFSRFWPYIPRPMPTWRPEPASGFAPVLSGCIPPAAAPLRTHGG